MEKLNHRLTPDDASFLYLEKVEMPLHIGSVLVFEGQLPYEPFVDLLDSKLHLIPRYRQKVMPAPFNVGHPTWEFDPAFHISRHIFQLKIDQPGRDEQLSTLAGRIYTGMLDRSKPLWELYVVNGLAGNRSALITKVHHCMVDGVSGVALMNTMLDASPDPPKIEKQPFQAPPLPDPTTLLVDALTSNYMDTLERLASAHSSFLNLSQTLISQSVTDAMRRLGGYVPEMAQPVDRLPFNRTCSGDRLLVWGDYSFNEARGIRGALGGTVNDVALTILTGAVAGYCRLHGMNTDKRFVRFMVPVSVRREEQRGSLGNRVSALPVSVPLDIEDPAQRMGEVTKRTEALKSARISDAISLMSAYMGAAPAPVQAYLGALPYLGMPAPPFNMVSTNVPGPQIPLYACGHRMLTAYPYVPVGSDMGIGCAIQSYNQRLFIGLTADAKAAPDVSLMRDELDKSFSLLRAAAGIAVEPKAEAPEPKRRRASRPRQAEHVMAAQPA